MQIKYKITLYILYLYKQIGNKKHDDPLNVVTQQNRPSNFQETYLLQCPLRLIVNQW